MNEKGHFDSESDASRFWAAIVESSDDAIIGKDLAGVVLAWNRSAERLYGYTADEITGRSIALLIPDDRRDELAYVLEQIGSGRRVEHLQTVRRTKDGRIVDVSLTVSPVNDATGRIVGGVAVTKDVTTRKRDELALRVSEVRWHSVIESAVDGIIVIDARGYIEAFNPAAERIFGFSEAEVLGQNVTVLMPAPYRDEHDGYLARYLETGIAKIIGSGRDVTGLRRD